MAKLISHWLLTSPGLNPYGRYVFENGFDLTDLQCISSLCFNGQDF